MEPAVALNLRSLRFHSPRLCRVAVFLIQTTVSLLEHQATARPARPRGPQAPPFFVSKCSYPRLLQPRAWSHLPLPTWMCWTSTGLIGCCPRLAAHLLLGVRHDLKMRELQHQDDLKDPAGRLRRLADLDHHLNPAASPCADAPQMLARMRAGVPPGNDRAAPSQPASGTDELGWSWAVRTLKPSSARRRAARSPPSCAPAGRRRQAQEQSW